MGALEQDWAGPAREASPEPVLDAAKLAAATAGAVTAVGAVLVLLGVATDDQVLAWATATGTVVLALGGLAGTVLPIWQAHRARALVTPLARPRDAAGAKLLPVGADDHTDLEDEL